MRGIESWWMVSLVAMTSCAVTRITLDVEDRFDLIIDEEIKHQSLQLADLLAFN